MVRFSSSILLLTFLLTLFAGSVSAGDGALSTECIDKIRNGFEMDAGTRALYNAISNNDLDKLALNSEILRQHNEIYTHKIKTKGITNQKSSGRCWIFAGLNVLRPIVIQKYDLDEFEFSQNYMAFWDKMEKANNFLEYIIEWRDRDPFDREMEIILDSPFGDGGYWKNAVALIKKYGLVPMEAMPETNSSSKTGRMNRIISRILRTDAVKLRGLHAEGKSVEELREQKETMLAEIYRILVMNLGEPPTEFEYRYEVSGETVTASCKYTPKSFYEEFVGEDLDEWVNFYHNPMQEYGRHYEVKLTKNMADQTDIDYANCDISVLKELTTKSVLGDDAVVFGADVGKDQSSGKGIMAVDIYDYGAIFGADTEMSKAERGLYRESMANHMMVFIGVDMRGDKPVKWLVENSWGSKKGSDGCWAMYDDWFDNHVYNVIIKKKYVPEEILKIYDQEIISLPGWDPMSAMFR